MSTVTAGSPAPRGALTWRLGLGLFAIGIVVSGFVYRAALDGPFVSDDYGYVAHNPLAHGLALENLWPIFDPQGAGVAQTVNYAPLHILLHASVWEISGADTRGHHLANVVLHVVVSVLLVAFFLRTGLPRLAALAGGLLFLVHPANVEAVAWIFQLKTVASMGFALAALLWVRARPAVATGLFALAVLTKISAAFALPVALVLAWTDARPPRFRRVDWAVFATWTALTLVVAYFGWQAAQRGGLGEADVGRDAFVQARTVCALAARYVAMATTTRGLSTFHEPAPAESLLDPWWLAGLAGLAFSAWRVLASLRVRSREAVYWSFAASAWLPVAQIVPFPFPLADRYLYTILPGLIGLVLLAALRGIEVGTRIARDVRPEAASARARAVAVAVAVCLAFVALFAARAADRARLWNSGALVVADAATNYPDGSLALLLSATAAARREDAAATALHLRELFERGYVHYGMILADPAFARVLREPEVRAVVGDMAGWWTRRARELEDPTQDELWRFAQAHLFLGETARARELLERALALGGARAELLRAELARLPPDEDGAPRDPAPTGTPGGAQRSAVGSEDGPPSGSGRTGSSSNSKAPR